MRIRTNPTLQFDSADVEDINVKLSEDSADIIEIEQGGNVVWVPIGDAIAFADAIKAYEKELTT